MAGFRLSEAMARRGWPLAAMLALSAPALAQRAPHPAEGVGHAVDLAWFVEVLCDAPQGAGRVLAALDPGCTGVALRTARHRALHERHDFPATHEAAARRGGYQRSTSFLIVRPDGHLEVVQTFDFGGGDRRFGWFDSGRGDGGQIVRIEGGTARITMTEDGSGGVQWFTGADCRHAVPPARSGWVLFSGTAKAEWTAEVAELRITANETDCPQRFDRSYTRWRLRALDWPVLFDGREEPDRATLPQQATVVSEHFGGESIERADHMERFYLVRGIGLARWERWEHVSRSKRSDLAARTERLAASGRCPLLDQASDAAPSEGWQRIDCRHWLNFVRTDTTHAPQQAHLFRWGREPLPGSRVPASPNPVPAR